MPAADACPDDAQLTLGIYPPDGFQIAKVDLIVPVNGDAPGRMRPGLTCGERGCRDQYDYCNKGAGHGFLSSGDRLTGNRVQLLDWAEGLFLPSSRAHGR